MDKGVAHAPAASLFLGRRQPALTARHRTPRHRSRPQLAYYQGRSGSARGRATVLEVQRRTSWVRIQGEHCSRRLCSPLFRARSRATPSQPGVRDAHRHESRDAVVTLPRPPRILSSSTGDAVACTAHSPYVLPQPIERLVSWPRNARPARRKRPKSSGRRLDRLDSRCVKYPANLLGLRQPQRPPHLLAGGFLVEVGAGREVRGTEGESPTLAVPEAASP